MAQRSGEEREVCAAEQEGDSHETGEAAAAEDKLKMVVDEVIDDGSYFPSQRMHSNGEQGNQTRSLPVSIYREMVWKGLEPREKESV